jgi:hypothetical protein
MFKRILVRFIEPAPYHTEYDFCLGTPGFMCCLKIWSNGTIFASTESKFHNCIIDGIWDFLDDSIKFGHVKLFCLLNSLPAILCNKYQRNPSTFTMYIYWEHLRQNTKFNNFLLLNKVECSHNRSDKVYQTYNIISILTCQRQRCHFHYQVSVDLD